MCLRYNFDFFRISATTMKHTNRQFRMERSLSAAAICLHVTWFFFVHSLSLSWYFNGICYWIVAFDRRLNVLCSQKFSKNRLKPTISNDFGFVIVFDWDWFGSDRKPFISGIHERSVYMCMRFIRFEFLQVELWIWLGSSQVVFVCQLACGFHQVTEPHGNYRHSTLATLHSTVNTLQMMTLSPLASLSSKRFKSRTVRLFVVVVFDDRLSITPFMRTPIMSH